MTALTGTLADPGELCAAGYWTAHVRQPVRFADDIRRLREQGVTRYLELGADGTLTALARACLDDPAAGGGRAGRRFTEAELRSLLCGAGFEVGTVHGVRVFADLVPGSLLDLEPGATAALLELERAVMERPEFRPLATQLHVLAR